MKMEIAVLAGADSKQFLVQFTKQVDRLEAIAARMAGGGATTGDTDETYSDEDTETAKPKRGRPAKQTAVAATSFDDDEDTGFTEETDTDTDFETEDEADFTEKSSTTKKTAAAKTPKYTLDDVNDACKAKAKAAGGGKTGREAVLKILKKNFNTMSVSELKPEQYGKAIGLMA